MQRSTESLVIKIETNKKLLESMSKKVSGFKSGDKFKSIKDNINVSKIILKNL